MNSPAVTGQRLKSILTQKRQARVARERQQKQLFSPQDGWKQTVEAKLEGLLDGRQMENFRRCGAEDIYCTCTGCGVTRTFKYNCNRKWCPRCQPRLSNIRAKAIKKWAQQIDQPKHLVLTQKNIPVLTRSAIRRFQKALAKLRRAGCWEKVAGGCCSLEITNEGNGWHLHAHLLLDTRWLPIEKLMPVWANLIQQPFAIVKVKDARGADYVSEICKYVAKGSELAAWNGDQINELVRAIKGVRMFFQFGSLFKLSAEIKRALALENSHPRECPCGCSDLVYQTEAESVLEEIRNASGNYRRRRKRT